MTIEQFVALAASGESETLEFKATTGTRREATMTVCAFLNQGGGQVLFGVTPDGTLAGQQVSERTIEELSAELRQIDPPAFPTVERVPVDDGREIIVVSTGQGASRPYSYRGTAYRRREIHARLGPEVSERQVRTTLEELRDNGLVTSTARGPFTRWRRVVGAG